jgi:hypothetical protein
MRAWGWRKGDLYLPARCEVYSEPSLCYSLEGDIQEGQRTGILHTTMEMFRVGFVPAIPRTIAKILPYKWGKTSVELHLP